MIEVQYRYSRDPENDTRNEMNSRKRSQGGDGEHPQPRKSVLQENEQKNSKDATRFIKIYRQIFIGYETPSAAHVSLAIIEVGGFLEQSQ